VRAGRLPNRLAHWPAAAGAPGGLDVRLAATFRARLLGLAGLSSLPRGVGLLLPGTRSAHTVGMRFSIDLVWLDARGQVLRVDEHVPPMRMRTCRHAAALLELADGGACNASLRAGATVPGSERQ
jgi:uncharacterized membrane protein (UPF0127 family)